MQSKERKGKWQPFDALEGYKDSLRNCEREKQKIEKPILFSDELECLNEKLLHAFNEKRLVDIKYYKNGFLENIIGCIEKIDPIYKEILVKTDDSIKKLKLNNILKIEDVE